MSHPAPLPSPRRREFVRFVCAAIVVVAALAFILADLGGSEAAAIARLAAAVSLVMISQWLVERRLSRRLARIEQWIDKAEYWKVYSDVMADLGGVDGEPSGEIPKLPGR